jgi:magnesium chelatase subunit I
MGHRSSTLGELRASGYPDETVKDEMRRNMVLRLRNGETLFPGIVGYDDTVIPSLVNAILSRHDVILLGLRGQAKTRIIRSLVQFLDDEIPIIAGSEVSDHPYHPVSKFGADLMREHEDDTPIEWIPRDARYGEKLATPDVTIADLIGDIDPIKAAAQRLHYAHEGVIHFGIIPRTNRGIFAINEVPDLQPRIQVGLLNILEEKDIQIRGFPVRIPLDVQIVFTANPEDYTNRGNIITPLKDRIGSQVVTHYPRTVDDGMAITAQEAWTDRTDNGEGPRVTVPYLFRQIIERTAQEARASEYVDQKSGVSARMTISAMEALVSNVERRAVIQGEKQVQPRICDLHAAIPAITGRLELVYEGEQEGATHVAHALISRGIRKLFEECFPTPQNAPGEADDNDVYAGIIKWFDSGNTLSISDDMSEAEYVAAIDEIPDLQDFVGKHGSEIFVDLDEYVAREFILEGLHTHSQLSKDLLPEGKAVYRDVMSELFNQDQSRER